MFTMFACKRCEIERIVGNYLLACLQMVAKLHFCKSTACNASANLMSGETILTLLWFSIESKDILLTIDRNKCIRRQGNTSL